MKKTRRVISLNICSVTIFVVFHWLVKGSLSMWSGVLTQYRRRRQFVPDDLKDDKYWARRRKNNMAAKRSRDARRMKENQIALRAGYLEKENMGLRQEVELLKKENHILREKLSKYADVAGSRPTRAPYPLRTLLTLRRFVQFPTLQALANLILLLLTMFLMRQSPHPVTLAARAAARRAAPTPPLRAAAR
ncbi:hypothetical protein MSG28_000732 [Choristoneura fumiferana]|uniref:Uncharacterized protein n=1 Tax=Choristoneura fumiferana TaxID=7141 RepID=A0ACC0K2L3_CHOFU|nr:hypothetical protein MSG28_000732 [Choristoneura fumiferana]